MERNKSMKKALNAWTVDSSVGFDEMFRQVKEAGFDGIELNVDAVGSKSHSLTFETSDSELEHIKNLSKRHELGIASISSSLYWTYGIGAADEKAREMSKQILRAQLKFAKALDAPGILVVPGGIQEQNSIAKAYETSIRTIMEMSPEIMEAQIYAGMENVWNGFFMSPYDLSVFVDKIDNPYVCAYFDVGNVVAFSWPEYWIEVLGERAKLIHIKGFKRGSEAFGGLNTGGTFVDLLEGDIKWDAVIAALRKTGFNSYLTAELPAPDKDSDSEIYYKDISAAMDTILSY